MWAIARHLGPLKFRCQVFVADASAEPSWTVPEQGYDRILIDAPCSGLGVIRRHPDIKHHRRPEDIVKLNEIQQKLLEQSWLLLKPGGKLLYMTCSILPSENQVQIGAFLRTHADALLAAFDHPLALELEFGKQTLPGVHNMDGFYYCLLEKHQWERCQPGRRHKYSNVYPCIVIKRFDQLHYVACGWHYQFNHHCFCTNSA